MPDIHEVVRRICLNFPESEEVISHGSPDYRVRDKSYATFTVNHHGDLRVALILKGSREQQAMLVESAPRIFFIPPYVGPKGWFGIDLAQGMRWERVAQMACDAYISVAPKTLAKQAVALSPVPQPDTVDIKQIDPLFAPGNQAVLDKLRRICVKLPEVTEGESFGSPVFRAGKKTFCQFTTRDGKPVASFWVGADRQPVLTLDKRFAIPRYTGHNGWISLKLDRTFDAEEITGLAIDSYKHFALKRMRNALPNEAP